MGKYKVITLCGSTKFKDDFLKVQTELTIKGIIVISLGLFAHSDSSLQISESMKIMLGDMHKQKINMADGIFVINKNGYIGRSTKMEIDYAKQLGKTVEYLESISVFNEGY